MKTSKNHYNNIYIRSRVENCKDIYLQRVGKCLLDAFHTFFIPEI